jgi:hypothetical protein
VRPEDFFIEDPIPGQFGMPSRSLNVTLLTELRRGPLADHEDVEVAVSLARLVHDDLERYGTDGGNELTDQGMREALLDRSAGTVSWP